MRSWKARLFGALVAALLALAVPAMADGSVNCGTGGYLYTKGQTLYSYNNQYHSVDGSEVGPFQSASVVTVPWGFNTGTHPWAVWGTNITYETAVCPT